MGSDDDSNGKKKKSSKMDTLKSIASVASKNKGTILSIAKNIFK